MNSLLTVCAALACRNQALDPHGSHVREPIRLLLRTVCLKLAAPRAALDDQHPTATQPQGRGLVDTAMLKGEEQREPGPPGKRMVLLTEAHGTR
mgnify:CR=1 FL=1